MYLFLLLKWWQSSILWSVLYRLHSLYHCCHSLSLIAICCHLLSLVVSLAVTLCHSLSFVVTRCTTRCHSLSFVVTRCTTRCHSLSLVVPLVVTRCTTRLSFYQRSWPDIMLNQKLTYYRQEIFLLTLKSDSEAILYCHCIVSGVNRAIERKVNVTWFGFVFVLISVRSHAQYGCYAIVFWRGWEGFV